jgi:hypothetical protein
MASKSQSNQFLCGGIEFRVTRGVLELDSELLFYNPPVPQDKPFPVKYIFETELR